MVACVVEHSADGIFRYFGTQSKGTTKGFTKSELKDAVFFDFYKDPEQLASEFFWEAYFLAEQKPVVDS